MSPGLAGSHAHVVARMGRDKEEDRMWKPSTARSQHLPKASQTGHGKTKNDRAQQMINSRNYAVAICRLFAGHKISLNIRSTQGTPNSCACPKAIQTQTKSYTRAPKCCLPFLHRHLEKRGCGCCWFLCTCSDHATVELWLPCC